MVPSRVPILQQCKRISSHFLEGWVHRIIWRSGMWCTCNGTCGWGGSAGLGGRKSQRFTRFLPICQIDCLVVLEWQSTTITMRSASPSSFVVKDKQKLCRYTIAPTLKVDAWHSAGHRRVDLLGILRGPRGTGSFLCVYALKVIASIARLSISRQAWRQI